MFEEKIYSRMKNYTRAKLAEQDWTGNISIRELPAEMLFENGDDIFINLHLPEANTPPDQLHGHDFFEVNYVLKGSCRQNIHNTARLLLEEGTLCIMNPDARHNLAIDSEEDVVLNILMKKSLFNSTFYTLIQQHESLSQFFLSYFLAQDASSDFLLYHTPNDAVTTLLQQICLEYLERKPYYRVTLRCLLVLFFTEVIRASAESAEPAAAGKNNLQISILFQYLSSHYATATLASTAAHFHYHPNYLSAFVRKHTGKTFRAILNDIKLSQANYYLCSTNLPMQEIAQQLGFQQLCNFYSFIRKNYGMTPVQYRQLHSVR